MRQLPLGIRLRAGSVFTSYWPGPNATAIDLLQTERVAGSGPLTYLYGPRGVGKTHLLQALCAQASERLRPASYLPLRELRQYGPEVLDGCGRLALVCLDDVACAIGAGDWEQALFNLYRELDEQGGRLVVADDRPALALEFGLPDLASRMLGGLALRLQPLDESQQCEALRLRAAQRGLEIPDEVLSYLLRRLRRDMGTLCAFVDELDTASLVAQRRLTLPFVRAVLDDKNAEGQS